jgi:O-antigen/teichoic acid export membrane protein
VLIAAHKVALSSFIEMFQTLAIFLLAIWFSVDPTLNFESMVAFVALTPVLVYLISSFPIYSKSLKMVRPHVSLIQFSLVPSLLNKGLQFFVIQITAVFLFTMGGFLAGAIYGMEASAEFGLINKYFAIPLMGFSIILTPFWAGFTDAWIKKDLPWISKVIRNLIWLWLAYFLFLILMVYFSDQLFDLWLGKSGQVPKPSKFVFLLGAIFTAMCAWGNIFSFFLNGIGFLRIQLLSSVVIVLVLIPLLWLLNHWLGLHYSHIFLAIIITMSVGTVLGPIQTYLVLRGKAKGIWRK